MAQSSFWSKSASLLFLGIEHTLHWCIGSFFPFFPSWLPLKPHSSFLMILVEIDCSVNICCLGLSLLKYTLFTWSIIQSKLVLTFQKHKIVFKVLKGNGSKVLFSVFPVKWLLCYSKKASVLFQVLTFMPKLCPKYSLPLSGSGMD